MSAPVCMYKIADEIEKRADELAQIETLDNGKPIKESRWVDVVQSVETFRYYAGWCTKLEGETTKRQRNFFTYTFVSRLASSVKSFRGTSRCLWQRGSWVRLWLAATRSFSSQPNKLRYRIAHRRIDL